MRKLSSRLFPGLLLVALVPFSCWNSPAQAQTGPTRAAGVTYSPAPAVYAAAQPVTLSTTTPGATIYYTLDGTNPTTSSAVFSSAITVSKDTRITAFAEAPGYEASLATDATYLVRAAGVTFSPANRVLAAPEPVTLSTTTPGATINYTLDGTNPTSSSPAYSTPITISQVTKITALASAPGYVPSLATSTYFYVRAALPTADPPPGSYPGTQYVMLSDAAPGATIYYTLDNTEPTTASAVYSAPIPLSTNTLLHAVAYAPSYIQSLDTPAMLYEFPRATAAAIPTFSPSTGVLTGPTSVTISDSTPSAVIHYTTNGGTPNQYSPVYTSPIAAAPNLTIRAEAVAPGFNDSQIGSATYTFQPAKPGFSLAAGAYLHTQSTTISDSTPVATIYYTTDGSTPSATHGIAIASGGTVILAANQTINAVAITAAPGWTTSSSVASSTYYIDPTSIIPWEWSYIDMGPEVVTSAASWTDASGNFWMFGGSLFYDNNEMWKFNPVYQEWTQANWSTGCSPAVYGTLGAPGGANLPGCRESAMTWTDASGNFWMFGGSPDLSDLWMFNPTATNTVTGLPGIWTWMGGGKGTEQPGVYGTLGVASGSSIPGSREGSTAWTDASGNLWLFGGYSFSGTDPFLNDLWEYLPNTPNPVTGINGEWVWMGGSSKPTAAAGVYNTQGIANDTSYPGGRSGALGFTDASGNLWLFSGDGVDGQGNQGVSMNDLWKFDPSAPNSVTGVNGVWTWMQGNSIAYQHTTALPTAGDGFMASWKDLSGNFWVFDVSAAAMWKYDVTANQWTEPNAVGSYLPDDAAGLTDVPSPLVGPFDPPYYTPAWTDANGYLWYYATTWSPNYALGQNISPMWMFDPYTPLPTPVMSPGTGAYTSPVSVTISGSGAGVTIYYTTDGSTPTKSSAVYSGPITVSGNETIVALAISAKSQSPLAQANYSF